MKRYLYRTEVRRRFGKRVRHTDLGLSYKRAFSITQRREGQAELRLSITLTETQREKIF